MSCACCLMSPVDRLVIYNRAVWPYILISACELIADHTVLSSKSPGADSGGGGGVHPARAPPKIGKNMIFWRKIVIFHTKYPKNFRASLRSAQFFYVRPPPPNLKSWNRPWSLRYIVITSLGLAGTYPEYRFTMYSLFRYI